MVNKEKSAKIFPESVVVASPDQIYSDLEDEAVILHLSRGIYYGLNPLGARIWQVIQEPLRVSQVRDRLVSEYDVEAQRCEQDLIGLLEELAQHRLIAIEYEGPK